ARNNSRVWAGKNGGERRRNGNKASPCRLLPGAGGRGGCRGHCRGGPNQMAGPVRVGTRQLSYCPRLACGNRRCEVGSASGFSTVPFLGDAGISRGRPRPTRETAEPGRGGGTNDPAPARSIRGGRPGWGAGGLRYCPT